MIQGDVLDKYGPRQGEERAAARIRFIVFIVGSFLLSIVVAGGAYWLRTQKEIHPRPVHVYQLLTFASLLFVALVVFGGAWVSSRASSPARMPLKGVLVVVAGYLGLAGVMIAILP